jgi:hypothetical protein
MQMKQLYMQRKYKISLYPHLFTNPFVITTKRIDSPEKNKKKPDLMLGYEDRKKQVFFFFVEMKRMNTTSKYQAEDDFVKLMKQQKLSVDTQLGLGVRSPVSYGLLCEGT